MAKPKGVPHNSSVIIPRLVCRDPAVEIDFCAHAFGAEVVNVRPGPDGATAHALLTIGSEMLMVETEWPNLTSRAPVADGSSPVVIFVYVEDVDAAVERAVSKGAKVLLEPQNQFWGDRIAWIMDPSGHVWTVATRIEETTETMRKDRWDEIIKEMI
jgi:PhnB protein